MKVGQRVRVFSDILRDDETIKTLTPFFEEKAIRPGSSKLVD